MTTKEAVQVIKDAIATLKSEAPDGDFDELIAELEEVKTLLEEFEIF